MGAVKKPKVKGKNRLRVGDTFGVCTSVAIVKTWQKGWRTAFKVGGKGGQHSQLHRDK